MAIYLFSDQVGPESVFSGEKGFDEPSWGTFDTHYDTDSVWGFDTDNPKVCEQLLSYIANSLIIVHNWRVALEAVVSKFDFVVQIICFPLLFISATGILFSMQLFSV